MAHVAPEDQLRATNISPAVRGRPLRYTRLNVELSPSWLLQLWVCTVFQEYTWLCPDPGKGEIDIETAPELLTDVQDALADGTRSVFFDLAQVSLFGVAGATILIKARRDCQRGAANFVLLRASSAAMRCPQVHRPRQASRSHPRRLVPFSIRPPNEVHCARSGRCPFHTDIECERGRRQSRPGASNGPSVAAATRQDNDEEGAIRSQRRPTRRDAVETAVSAVASTWAIVVCGLRRRAVTASSCISERATGRATAISSHRRSRRDNKAHISGGPVGVNEYQSVAPCGHSYTLGSLRAIWVCWRTSHAGRGFGVQLVQGVTLEGGRGAPSC